MWNYSKNNRIAQQLDQNIKDAVGSGLQNILAKYNIEYNNEIHDFVLKKDITMNDISQLLTTQSSNNIRAIIYSLREQELQKYSSMIIDSYNKFKEYGISEKDFSYLLQSSGSGLKQHAELKPIIEKLDASGHNGSEIVENFRTHFASKIIKPLWSLKQEELYGKVIKIPVSEHLRNLFVGKVTIALKQMLPPGTKIDDKNVEEYISENFKPFTKKELLDSAGFNENKFPLRISNYWPDLKHHDAMYEKIKENIDIDDPKTVGEALRSAVTHENVNSIEQNRIKFLFINQFQKNTGLFLDYIKQIFIKDQYAQDSINEFENAVKEIVEADSMVNERKRDTLFNNTSSYFASIQEKEIVDLIRNEFKLQCVASNMKFPITNDYSLNKRTFIVDFIMYCDILNGIEAKSENGQQYYIPDINKQAILIGEYYGFGGNEIRQKVEEDLYDPDGNLVYKAGDQLTRTQYYQYKTQFKKITENFCAKAIGCKTLSINQAGSRKKQIQEIQIGLDDNSVLYNGRGKMGDQLPESKALNDLINWYNSADELSKQKSTQIIEKYYDIQTGQKKYGGEYEINKYETAIEASKKYISSSELRIAIEENKQHYIAKNLKSEETSGSYLQQIRTSMQKISQINTWRIQYLDNLSKVVEEAFVHGMPINENLFLSCLRAVQDQSNDQNDMFDLSQIIKTAFNWRKIQRLSKQS